MEEVEVCLEEVERMGMGRVLMGLGRRLWRWKWWRKWWGVKMWWWGEREQGRRGR